MRHPVRRGFGRGVASPRHRPRRASGSPNQRTLRKSFLTPRPIASSWVRRPPVVPVGPAPMPGPMPPPAVRRPPTPPTPRRPPPMTRFTMPLSAMFPPVSLGLPGLPTRQVQRAQDRPAHACFVSLIRTSLGAGLSSWLRPRRRGRPRAAPRGDPRQWAGRTRRMTRRCPRRASPARARHRRGVTWYWSCTATCARRSTAMDVPSPIRLPNEIDPCSVGFFDIAAISSSSSSSLAVRVARTSSISPACTLGAESRTRAGREGRMTGDLVAISLAGCASRPGT